MTELRALSLTPPWPWAVFDLGKTIENRTRLPAPRFRGRMAVHAGGLRPEKRGYANFTDALAFIRRATGIDTDYMQRFACLPDLAQTEGAIVGVVDVVGHVEQMRSIDPVDSPERAMVVIDPEATVPMVRDLTDAERRWWMGGPAYVLANPRKLAKPVPCKGALGLWRVPPDVAERVREQLR